MDHQPSATLRAVEEIRVEKGQDRVRVQVKVEEFKDTEADRDPGESGRPRKN